MNNNDNKVTRRSFICDSAMVAAGLSSVFSGCKSNKEKEPNAADSNAQRKAQKPGYPQVPTRMLGKTGIAVPSLALGALFNLVENQTILEKSFQWGVRLWDTAPDYAGENSERGIGKFILRHPDARKKLFLVTKASDAVTIDDVEKALQASLKRMNTKYIDIYYIMDRMAGSGYVGHGLSDPAKLTDDLRQWVESAKKRNLIRFFGFSTHKNMAKCLAAAARLGWIDVAMTTYSYRIMQDNELQDAIQACHKAGIGLIAMKTQGRPQEKIETEEDKKLAGQFLQKGFTEGQAKIKAVLQDKRFSSACVGMQDVSILAQNVAAVLDKTNLTKQDVKILKEHASATCSGYCAGCANICDSALPDTPFISDIMRYLMYYNSYGDRDRARELFAQIPAGVRNRLLSTDYSLAETRCPQHLPIAKLVAEAVSKLA
jgi:aryl-alcohol dehydrogenase-like predicted oxidoreductase